MIKKVYFYLVMLVAVGIFISCSEEENEFSENVKKFELVHTVGINLTSGQVFGVDGIDESLFAAARTNDSVYYQKVQYIFTCDASMPRFSTQKELEQFLVEHPSETTGSFELIIDDKLAYRVKVTNGVKHHPEFFETEPTLDGKYPCTYKGIKACAIDGIHSQNWFQMTQCVIEGLGCVIEWYINCTIDNC
jgi:hypothetical protein